MQYGPTMGSQDRFHRTVTPRLSPTISFDDVHLALALDDMEPEPRPATLDENGKPIPVPLREFENGMQHDRVFDSEGELDHKYLSFAAETELRENYLQRELKSAKQFLS